MNHPVTFQVKGTFTASLSGRYQVHYGMDFGAGATKWRAVDSPVSGRRHWFAGLDSVWFKVNAMSRAACGLAKSRAAAREPGLPAPHSVAGLNEAPPRRRLIVGAWHDRTAMREPAVESQQRSTR